MGEDAKKAASNEPAAKRETENHYENYNIELPTSEEALTNWRLTAARVFDFQQKDKNFDAVVMAISGSLIPEGSIADFIRWFFQEHGNEVHIDRSTAEVEAAVRRDRILAARREETLSRERNLEALKTKLADLDAEDPESEELAESIIEDFHKKNRDSKFGLTPGAIDEFEEFAASFRLEDLYQSALFDGLTFRNGTLSAMAGRTGRGKTVAMASLTIEALLFGKSVTIVTFEDNFAQYVERCTLNLFRRQFLDAGNRFYSFRPSVWPEWTKEAHGQPVPRFCLYAMRQGFDPQTENSRSLATAFDLVKTAVESGKLSIIDGRGGRFQDIIKSIEQNPADLTLIDYIQRVPAPEELLSHTRQVQVQFISAKLTALAAKLNSIFIVGAQFNRINTKNSGGKAHGYDIFTDESFREAGDIEQDAFNAIGIGQEEEKRTTERYYRVLKARESNPGDGYKKLLFYGAYSLMYPTGEAWHPPKKQSREKKKSGGDDIEW